MVLLNSQVYELYPQLCKLRESSSTELPVKVAFTIIRDIKTLEPIYMAADDLRSREIQKYGTPQEDGGIVVEGEALEELNKRLAELGQCENDIPLDKIPLSSLDGSSFTIDEMNALYVLIDGEA